MRTKVERIRSEGKKLLPLFADRTFERPEPLSGSPDLSVYGTALR